jgi:type I restriction-modification system DNA methylase subunit
MNDIEKEKIKISIIELVEKYDACNISYNEEMTKKDFILPLFRLLGWATEDSNEVKAEEKISKKRVDYSFRINGIPKFFLEAKSLKEDLSKEKFIEQAINYSWHKGCTWAVLTNFKEIKIYNAEWRDAPHHSHLMTINYKEFITRFDDLWLLSKESFQLGLLDKEAEKWGKKSKKIPIDQQLLKDFTYFREILSKDISKNNNNLSQEELDESVQRILDRLIFIRNCEDRELETIRLSVIVREWQEIEKKVKGQLSSRLKQVFFEYDKIYNSKIFTFHLCDTLTIDDSILEEIIEGLYYTKDKTIYYDFSAIEADVLGNIYEQYLGHILKKSAKRAKLTHSASHRKEQGIYYTPSYIVDFIIKNTVGEILRDKKNKSDKIRILDPACGSGSFLIKAYDVLNDFWKEKNKDYEQGSINFEKLTFTKREEILRNNIFGVDLDKQAVEIAQLNLFLKLAEKGQKLPLLNDNIKCGNSLIDDPKIAGDKAFNWNNEFSEIINDGGFDVIIGNPPWISFGLRGVGKLNKEESIYIRKQYFSAEYKLSTYALFIERSIQLLSDQGYLSFILPDSFLLGRYFSKLRKFIINNCVIKKILLTSYDVFSKKATTGRNVIIVLKKENRANIRSNNKMEIIKVESELDFLNSKFIKFTYSQNYFENLVYNRFRLFFCKEEKLLVEKIEKNSISLGNFMSGHTGIRALVGQKNIISKTKKSKTWHKGLISGSQIGRYWLKYDNDYININPQLLNKGGWDPNVVLNDKILVRQTGDRIYATLDTERYYHLNNIHSFKLKNDELSLKYILALLNSKLMSSYYLLITLEKKRTMAQTDIETIEKLPIKIASKHHQNTLIKYVDKMLVLNKRLLELQNKKTDEREKILQEIKKTDALIDEIVYEIYGISDEEKQIIESNLN